MYLENTIVYAVKINFPLRRMNLIFMSGLRPYVEPNGQRYLGKYTFQLSYFSFQPSLLSFYQ